MGKKTAVTLREDGVAVGEMAGMTRGLHVDVLMAQLAGVTPGMVKQPMFVPPDGTKWFLHGKKVNVLVHQTPPSMQRLKWVKRDEHDPDEGKGGKFKEVNLALPYVTIMAAIGKQGMVLGSNECFFSNWPIKTLGDRLCYPALLNCSKWQQPTGNALSWICTQWLSQKNKSDLNSQLRHSVQELFACLLGTGFNYSSEMNEGNSWFTATQKAKVHPDIVTVAKWEKRSKKEPMFVLDVPWLETGLTVAQIARRVQRINGEESAGAPLTGVALVKYLQSSVMSHGVPIKKGGAG